MCWIETVVRRRLMVGGGGDITSRSCCALLRCDNPRSNNGSRERERAENYERRWWKVPSLISEAEGGRGGGQQQTFTNVALWGVTFVAISIIFKGLAGPAWASSSRTHSHHTRDVKAPSHRTDLAPLAPLARSRERYIMDSLQHRQSQGI